LGAERHHDPGEDKDVLEPVINPHNPDVGHNPVNAGRAGGGGRHRAEPRQRGPIAWILPQRSKSGGAG
jgi:hypothetical protein